VGAKKATKSLTSIAPSGDAKAQQQV